MREVASRIDAIGVVLDGVEGYSLLSMDEQGTVAVCMSYDLEKEFEGCWPNQTEFEQAVTSIYNERYAPKAEDTLDMWWCPGCEDNVETMRAVLPGHGALPVRLCLECGRKVQ